ncbi:acyltransferase family protein [bacterium]|nr:acyltransferase family protein [bacterium]
MAAGRSNHRLSRRAAARAVLERFDPAAADLWMGRVRAVLWPYFRPQLIGTEHLPTGRALLIGRHSGVIPYDAACAMAAIHEATGRVCRAFGDRFFALIPGMERLLNRCGAGIADPAVVEAALREEHAVLVFPGGTLDMQRPYLSDAYRVVPHRGFAPGHGGYVKLALRTGAPIVPLAVVGAEEAHVLLGNWAAGARLLGTPLLPFVLFPLPLPVKLYLRLGRPIHLRGTPADAARQDRVDALNRVVQRRLQRLIDDTVRRRRGIVFSRFDQRGTR